MCHYIVKYKLYFEKYSMYKKIYIDLPLLSSISDSHSDS